MSAFLAINGTELPPCKRGVSVLVTTVVDSGRNANGVVVGQKIGRDQYKIDNLEWSYLTADEWEGILSLMTDFFFNVTFYDPVTQSKKTLKMYCGDRSAEPYWVNTKTGKPTAYINCKVNLVDVGEV